MQKKNLCSQKKKTSLANGPIPTLWPGLQESTLPFNKSAALFVTRFAFFPMFCRHIYIPLGGSRHGPLWQFLAAIACFSFTCFWHGALDYILAWTAFNLVIVGGEALAYYVVDKPRVKEFEVHVMFKWSFVRRPYSLSRT